MIKIAKIVILALVLAGCRSTKDVLYFQNAQLNKAIAIAEIYESKIQRDDILAITVESNDAEAAKPFNKALPTIGTGTTALMRLTDRGYLVSEEGAIIFPMLGKIFVAGKTKSELAKLVEDKLVGGEFLKDPRVSVALLNFKFSVLGESGRPNTYSVQSERLTLPEALSMAGDININAGRDILIIRESDGTRTIGEVDMRSTSFMASPYYYIHPNDVIYIRPNQTRVNQSSDRQLLPLITSIISLIVTIATFAIVTIK